MDHCGNCGAEFDFEASGSLYCSDDCEEAFDVDAVDEEPEPDESPCNHSHHAWRDCFDCKAAYGDLQYQRMKEGDHRDE